MATAMPAPLDGAYVAAGYSQNTDGSVQVTFVQTKWESGHPRANA